MIRFTAPTLGLAIVLGGLIAMTLGSGCASKNPDLTQSASNQPASDAPRPSALDVGPARPSTPVYVAPTEAPAAPATSSARLLSDPENTPTPTLVASSEAAGGGVSGGGASAGGSSYTVQHGDTLFRIAKEHYGDGKQWRRIASANPGVTPASLKAGQKIVLP